MELRIIPSSSRKKKAQQCQQLITVLITEKHCGVNIFTTDKIKMHCNINTFATDKRKVQQCQELKGSTVLILMTGKHRSVNISKTGNRKAQQC